MKKIVSFLFLSLFFFSCEEDLNVDIPVDRSRLSVTSYLHADDYFNGQNSCVYVSNSISALESTDNFVYTDSVPVINNATVSIYETNSIQEDVASYLLDFNYDCYCYINTNLSPKPNTSYRLQVDLDGFPSVNARDKVPSNPSYEITDFEMLGQLDKKSFNGVLSQFNLVLFDGTDGLICSNRGFEKKLNEGETYAIGNKPLEQKSEKIISAEEDFVKILSSEVSGKNLFEMMQAPVNKPLEFSEAFTKENHGREFPYRFIATDIYGTRSTTSIIIDKNNEAEIEETSFNEAREIVKSKKFKLEIK